MRYILKAHPYLLFLALAGSCRAPGWVDRDVREYVRLAVALGERDSDSLDLYIGPSDWVADIRKQPPTIKQVALSANTLADRLKRDRGPRSARMLKQVQAIAARATALSKGPEPFDDESYAYFGIKATSVDESSVRDEIHSLLRVPYADYDAKFLIDPSRVEAVITRAIQGCRDQTRDHIRLPAGESVTVEYVHDRPWSAYSRYQGNFRSIIQINTDLGLTVDRALQLACHEAYPGHHVYNVLQDLQFVRRSHWKEWTVQPTFSPQSMVSEALATLAVDVAFPGRERLRFERDALFPLAGLDPRDAEKYEHVSRLVDQLHVVLPEIARDFLDGKLEWSRAVTALEQRALMAHPEETLKYLNEYRTYVLTYTTARDRAAQLIDGWPRYEQFVTNPDAASVMMNK